MNYWCTDIANLSDCFEPLTQLVEKLAYNGEKNSLRIITDAMAFALTTILIFGV